MIGVIVFLLTFAFLSSLGQDTSGQQTNNYGIGVEDKWHKEMNMINEMINRFDRDNIRETLRYLSEKPHIAASPRDNELAEYVRTKFEEAGFDSSKLVPYNIYLSKPNPENPNKITLDMNGETIFESHFKEVPIHEDDDDPDFIHAFNAYTPAGTVSTEPGVGVVYVNYGRIEDFERLEELGINVTGHIVIVRYGKIFRGNKVSLAEKFGAKGIIIFSDPKDVAADGIAPENVYDHTWWLPGTGMQRGSTFIGGDPLTPGWPATEHAYRISEDEVEFPKIPGQPIGYSDAFEILNQNESVSLTLSTHNSGKVEKSYNVIGIIKGSIEPDRYVMIGNHRDAWGYGAIDPSSGTAQVLETARVFGTFLKEGWRPRRTIIFCSWGAEEFSLIGSSEWVEENIEKLQSRGVSYINTDTCTSGPELYIESSPLMQELFLNVTNMIPGVKDSSKTLLEEWREYGERYRPNAKEYPIVYNISVKHPSYHTGYETFYMVTAFIDPEFKRHEGCGRLSILALKYLADSSILPYSLGRLPSIMMSNLQNNKNRERLIQMYDKYIELENSMKKLGDSVSKFEDMIKSFTSLSELQIRAINDQMMKLEQIFILPQGLPGRPSVRNTAFASSNFDEYSSSGFPALSDLLYDFDKLNQTEQQSRTKMIKRHISDLTIMTDRAAAFLEDVYLI
ncbi:putative zinc metalloprotease TRE2 [Armadillidium nasatum]|uniref:Putative zinc metalloprotease TRE2 n=1 Tax=Armadillidium nasatum TaxID=96803 RepID=A0A5N5SPP7_9CRUS|nr:putative zinc metalloprotease TRE2 [Armadillidium nasatum]